MKWKVCAVQSYLPYLLKGKVEDGSHYQRASTTSLKWEYENKLCVCAECVECWSCMAASISSGMHHGCGTAMWCGARGWPQEPTSRLRRVGDTLILPIATMGAHSMVPGPTTSCMIIPFVSATGFFVCMDGAPTYLGQMLLQYLLGISYFLGSLLQGEIHLSSLGFDVLGALVEDAVNDSAERGRCLALLLCLGNVCISQRGPMFWGH